MKETKNLRTENTKKVKGEGRKKNKTDLEGNIFTSLMKIAQQKEVKRKEKNLEKRERDQIKLEIQHQKERKRA